NKLNERKPEWKSKEVVHNRLTSSFAKATADKKDRRKNVGMLRRTGNRDVRRMEIRRVGSQSSTKGPVDWFTGTVRIDPLFQANAPTRASDASVTFKPGARTAWHTHPLGQTLIVTAGRGWVQREGGAIEEIRPGDVVWFPPNEKHWHGVTPT